MFGASGFRKIRNLDMGILFSCAGLLGLGMLALYSAAFQKMQATGVDYLGRQLTWIGLGVCVASVLVWIDYHRWLEWGYWLWGVTVILLCLVLVVGTVRGGAQRWLTFGGLAVQPSELAKVAIVLTLTRYLGDRRDLGGFRWGVAMAAAGWVLIPMALILMQPNLGTAWIFAVVGLGMLVAWGLPWKGLLTIAIIGMACLPIGWRFLADYQRSRLMVFLNPNLDPLGAGYTVIQSKIALGSGYLLGKGWLSGTQNQLNFLPERHTDFIFSVIGEEWGFLGTSVCLALFALLFLRAMRIAIQTRDPYGRLLVVGLVILLAAHTVINTGMVMGFMPVVGLPLPFISYGGSWMTTCLVAVGMILSVGMRRP
jgi:rod shape determining protein RodA